MNGPGRLDPHKHRHLWLNVKVQGEDGRWSNLDTRVALRFQNVVNAEGDLACPHRPRLVDRPGRQRVHPQRAG